MTRLSQQSKKVNWAKLRVTGATLALEEVTDMLHITPDERVSLLKAINKIHVLMSNKLAEDYEAFKATELFERETKGGLSKAARK